jgi:hypothetical protein
MEIVGWFSQLTRTHQTTSGRAGASATVMPVPLTSLICGRVDNEL